MTLDDYVHNHLKRGSRGGFAAELATAWCVADSGNRAKLERSFSSIFMPPADLTNRRYTVHLDRPVWMRETYLLTLPDSVSDEDAEQACVAFLQGNECPPGIREVDATTPEFLDGISGMDDVYLVVKAGAL